MILPCPENLRAYDRFPLTITLAVLNIFIFILIFDGTSSYYGSSRLLSEDGLSLTGRLYFQYLKEQSPQELYSKPSWVHEMKPHDPEHLVVLGSYALRDAKFVEAGEGMKFWGDEVQIATWKKDFAEFRKLYREQMLYRFGLSSLATGPFSWLTYQFSHSSWMHLFSNLVFLIVMGAAVESLVGSGMLLFIYVLGGVAGGAGFLLSQFHGTVPMVGASASISALLAFYCLAETRKRVRYFFVAPPMMGQDGFIYLPTLLILPLFLLVDLASFWSTPEGLGSGVAYAAHLGGTVFGLLAGAVYRLRPQPQTHSAN
ncbi:rhomboid family intramembrane serine protease [Bdellovibrio sp. HCB2-146]|uniref:rhomboid family intramembrane serine protease n=1 Tax=Bdellovibrio sp. HCB2-146 TaxID=3394362 RepID=UPI0039BCE014